MTTYLSAWLGIGTSKYKTVAGLMAVLFSKVWNVVPINLT
jgi:hypothetical protein